jgi:protein-disulfide isomerase
MASRAEQKQQAREARIEYERKLAEDAKRKKRLAQLGGVVVAAVVIIVAAVIISSNNSTTANNTIGTSGGNAAVKRVSTLLAGIPQSGTTLGNPNAPIQITMYGDLECSACDTFTLPTNINTSNGTPGSGYENQMINNWVRTGKASLVYRSLDTATGQGATPNEFTPQQAAAYAAGLQGKAWQYIELFYNEQHAEGSTYVDQSFLNGIAKQIPGLNYQKWLSDSQNPSLANQVNSDQQIAASHGWNSTPTIVIKGPKGQAQAIQGVPASFSQYQSEFNQVG